MKLLKFSELDEFPRALIKVYSCIIALLIIACALIAWLGDVNTALTIVALSIAFLAIAVVFIYLVDCFMYIDR